MARAGDVVGGKYRLIHPLGIGGMGAVWRAEHLALKQNVAIKLLDARGPNAERAIMRFQREAQIAASIRHRNIVYISDFGTGRDPYLVMELLSGVPLSERMVVGEPLAVSLFLRIIEEVLEGLSAVHAAGVVHRDMKPENIFLVRDSDGALFPKLLDFGVSRSTERGQGHTITREGVVMGTPEYVSPEHARGRPADARGDIYSLGVVMYEALAGRLPFQADNPADLIVAMLNSQPVPLVSFRPDLGESISRLVGKAMARSPEDRFQSSDEMRAALCELVRDQRAVFDKACLPRRFITPPDEADAGQAEEEMRLVPTASFPPETGGVLGWLKQGWGRSARATGLFALLALLAGVLLMLPLWGGSDAEGGGKVHAAPVSSSLPVVPVLSANPAGREVEQPEKAAHVEVVLLDLPDRAVVKADGSSVAGPLLQFPRDSGTHEITVESPGYVPFKVAHDASADGEYRVAMKPLSVKGPAKRSTRSVTSPARRGATSPKPPRRPGGLLRTPDF